jgi:hypothetical protein
LSGSLAAKTTGSGPGFCLVLLCSVVSAVCGGGEGEGVWVCMPRIVRTAITEMLSRGGTQFDFNLPCCSSCRKCQNLDV